MMRRVSLATGLTISILAAGCSFAPKQAQPVVVADIPDDYQSAPDSGAHQPSQWWTVFNDPVLERLVDTALAANLDLREAVARVEEVRQRYRIARADLVPSLAATADASYSSSPANVGIGGEFGIGQITRFDFETYSASLGLSYEVDFWGRANNDTKAAVSDFLATESDYRTARLAVIAATISTYLEIVDLQRRVELTGLNVELLADRADLTDQRYFRGLTSSFELYTFRSLYRNTQAGLPILESQLADAHGRLAVLLGRYVGSLDELLTAETGDPAIVLDPVPTDLPAALLEERPDVMAAWRRMEAARFRIGARKAELYPAIRLNASAGLQSSSVSDLFRVDQYFLNLLGGLTAPLLQGGRLRANASAAEAVFQQRAAAYVRAVLTAYSEVETSLQNLENQKERYAFLQRQRISAQGSVDFQLRSLERGVGSYIEYLDARSNLVAVETNLATAERALAEGRLGVHRALGGSWVVDDDLNDALQQQYRRLGDELVPVENADDGIDESDVIVTHGDVGQ